ncbi:DUF5680 domain-containing protein [Thermogemmatispora sp.]|uniref:DUF5680 domain-containing protein n=1 Tax=Thermogemmatispora sp. TaxID=1968838 RepID=UPI0035E42E5C
MYAFLRSALRQISVGRPFRAPSLWEEADLRYLNRARSDPAVFDGLQEVSSSATGVLYRLRCCGGFLR